MKKIIGIDLGFGDCKITYGTEDGEIIKKFKFPSMIAITKKLPEVTNNRIKVYEGHAYTVGDEARNAPSKNLIDITDYANLEFYAPLLCQHAIDIIGETPDIVVTGLSIAQYRNSGYFQANLQKYTIDDKEYKHDHVFVIPQGAGAKLTIDKYGANFPKEQTEFLGETTFVGCDIGFNTLDMFLVNDGETDPNLFTGIEHEGVMKIAKQVAKEVHNKFSRQITLHEAKQIIDTGVYKLRGKKHNFNDFVQDTKLKYLKNLLTLVDTKYPDILDKADFISISGGGSIMFKNTKDEFIRIPTNAHEYYNAIGQYLYGIKQVS
jgi:hypothetical protein